LFVSWYISLQLLYVLKCIVTLNGKKVKACQTGLPAGKSVIQTL
jgi:hypothetical protein